MKLSENNWIKFLFIFSIIEGSFWIYVYCEIITMLFDKKFLAAFALVTFVISVNLLSIYIVNKIEKK